VKKKKKPTNNKICAAWTPLQRSLSPILGRELVLAGWFYIPFFLLDSTEFLMELSYDNYLQLHGSVSRSYI